MKKEFKKMSCEEFKNKYKIDILSSDNKEVNFDFLLNTLDNSDNIGYFSASLDGKDVLYDIEDEKETDRKLNLTLIEVDGIYLAIY